jgi:hypothetical protein
MCDVAAGGGEQFEVALGQVYPVHPDESRSEQTEAVQAFNWRAPVLPMTLVDFVAGFVDMAMDGQIQLFGKG